MEHFVTLFDSLYLPQGLALHRSMERHIKNYQLWVVCVDDLAFEILSKIKLNNVRLIRLSDYETEELKKVKLIRSKVEYCWTLTPFAPRFVFEIDKAVKRATYLDADIWFRKNPTLIFKEFDDSCKDLNCYKVHTIGDCYVVMSFTGKVPLNERNFKFVYFYWIL